MLLKMENTTKYEKRIDFTPMTLKKAFNVLDCFSMEEPEHTAKELIYMCGISPPSLYRYLTILEEGEYLRKDIETNKYTIGTHIIELSGIALNRMDFRRQGEPALDRISSELKMNTNMGILYKGDLLHIAFAVWQGGEPNYSIIGRRTSAVCTAMGKVILSSLETKELHEIITRYGWRPRTAYSIQNFKDLDAAVIKIRSQGYAVDIRENSEGCCLAFPVLDQKGRVAAAISVSTTFERFNDEFEAMLKCVKNNTEEVTRRMGYNGPYPLIKPLKEKRSNHENNGH
jgi:DNA-binding IclR family transcriptional regulator